MVGQNSAKNTGQRVADRLTGGILRRQRQNDALVKRQSLIETAYTTVTRETAPRNAELQSYIVGPPIIKKVAFSVFIS